MAFLQLRSGDRGLHQEPWRETTLQQVADCTVELRNREGGDAISAQGGGKRDPSKCRPRR